MDKIFGQFSKHEIIRKTMTATRMMNNKNRKAAKKHQFMDIKRLLYNQFRLDEFQASTTNKEDHFGELWEPVYSELTILFA